MAGLRTLEPSLVRSHQSKYSQYPGFVQHDPALTAAWHPFSELNLFEVSAKNLHLTTFTILSCSLLEVRYVGTVE